MDFTIGSLELNRSDPAHIGTKALMGSQKALDSGKSEKVHGSFESMLLEAASAMNDQQIEVSKLQEKVITDPDSVDIHDVTTAMAKAKMSLSLAQTVIDRLISGWNELSQTR